jgi:NAD(P)-dependent dehydrogenase (short-subunit alcohol dehydrogenase family)
VAKAAVIALAKALARDLARRGIRVNSIAPGSILFPGGGWDRRQKADPEGIAAFVERELPFGRFGTPAVLRGSHARRALRLGLWRAPPCALRSSVSWDHALLPYDRVYEADRRMQ